MCEALKGYVPTMRRGCLILGLLVGLSVYATSASAETTYRTWEITLQPNDATRALIDFSYGPL